MIPLLEVCDWQYHWGWLPLGSPGGPPDSPWLHTRGEARPGAQQVEERVTRAVSVHELAVAQQCIVWLQEACAHRAAREQVVQGAQRRLGGQPRRVVAHDGHAEAAGVVAACVRAHPVPAPALVHVAV